MSHHPFWVFIFHLPPVYFLRPGPARYVLPSLVTFDGHDPSKKRNPAFSIGPRLPYTFIQKTVGPGPAGIYLDGRLTRFGPNGQPHWTIKSRLPPMKDFTNAPGPGTYNPKLLDSTPKYSIGARVSYRKRDDIPSPNTYALPPALGMNLALYSSNPGFTQGGRTLFGSYHRDFGKTPGPARYGPVSQDVYMKSRPEFSLLGRFPYIEPKPFTPGPGHYYPECVVVDKPIAPKHSFGIKHSEFVAPVTFELDSCG